MYSMRMARVNVYLPDELADEVKRADLNVSRITQAAVRAELAATASARWLERVGSLASTGLDHDRVVAAIRDARSELEG